MRDTVSIIIPVYNSKEYLRACIDSVINQTYKNIEIILVNDASTDGSYEICQEYKNADKRIKLTSLAKNSGQSAARNAGVKIATGDWIGFIDNDDTMEPKMIEVLQQNAHKSGVLVSGCANNRIEDGKVKVCNMDTKPSGIYKTEDIVENILYYPCDTWVEIWTKIYHKSLIPLLHFPEGMQLEDYVVNLPILLKVKEVYFDNRALYNWFIRPTSQSDQLYFDNRLSYFDACDVLTDKLKDIEASDKILNAEDVWEFCLKCKLLADMVKTKDAKNIKKAKELYPSVTPLKGVVKHNNKFSKKAYLHCLMRLSSVKMARC